MAHYLSTATKYQDMLDARAAVAAMPHGTTTATRNARNAAAQIVSDLREDCQEELGLGPK